MKLQNNPDIYKCEQCLVKRISSGEAICHIDCGNAKVSNYIDDNWCSYSGTYRVRMFDGTWCLYIITQADRYYFVLHVIDTTSHY